MLRVMMGNADGSADIIPVDMAVNLIIAAAWSTAIERWLIFKTCRIQIVSMNLWTTVTEADFVHIFILVFVVYLGVIMGI